MLETYLGKKDTEVCLRTVRVGFEYSILSLDPRIGGENASQALVSLLFEGLTRYDKDGYVELAIAETIEISSDGLEYIFKLQPSYWNDGSLLTAYDFEYAWKKILSPEFPTSFAYLFYSILGAKEAKEGKIPIDKVGIQVIDDLTLRVQLEHPAPYFLELVSHPSYSPVHQVIDQTHPDWPFQTGGNFLCNGPFTIEENLTDLSYKMVKNRYYWAEDVIDLDEIHFSKMSSFQAFQAYRRGEIDWLGNPLCGWMKNFVPLDEDQVVMISGTSMVGWHVFNTSKWPFHNLKLRQAISLAIDRSTICEDAFIKITPAYSPLLATHSHNAEAKFPHFNLEDARKLWKEGWKELGVDADKIPRLQFIYNYKGIRDHVVSHLKQQLKEALGLECDFIALPWPILFGRMTKGDFQMGLMQWTSWVNDSIYTLNGFRFASDDTNFSKWENTTFQELLYKADHEVDPERRETHLAQAESILCREMPVIPLFYQPYQAMMKKNLDVSYNVSRAVFNFAKCFYKK